ncbi:CIC11C00000004036 [Sungouiella intermedia]|uniref:serine C-palmitoyltransferase n=1 Tax=Sungouiella intermedia TaxID=45354 RepID=A0A1L0C498_9ASCO|nr:CIC11C00000004036 [[Candida] intermedia]
MSVETVTTFTTAIPSTVELLEVKLAETLNFYLNYLERIPGGLIIQRYIRSSYRDDPIRSVFEFALFLFAVHYFLSSKKKENKSELVKFSKKEIDDLVEEWEPAPLVDEVTELEHWRLAENHVKGKNGAHIELVQHPEYGKVVNLSSLDFLNLNGNSDLDAAARLTIASSGVGACGPPNFYGTQDVHVRLEEDLARYLGSEQAILYGQDFVTAGSVIPAFLKRGDLAVVDSGVSLAIQKALIVSRCDIEWFDHNDMEHLDQILSELKPMLSKQKLRRRFIVTEAMFAYSGDIANLPEIVELKNKYKYRLFVDETLSIGTLGKSGRGITEHFGISRDEISITIGSLANAFASSGGFCVGVRPMVHHQRINSIAYVFSAALPPYSAKVVSETIKLITESENSDGQSAIISALQEKVKYTYEKLTKKFTHSKYLSVKSCLDSPIIHLGFTDAFREKLDLPPMYGNSTFLTKGRPERKLNKFSHHYNVECYIMQKIINTLLVQQHTLINRTRIVYEQENLPVESPRLLIHINSGVSHEELNAVISALPTVVNEICSKLKGPADLFTLENELMTL